MIFKTARILLEEYMTPDKGETRVDNSAFSAAPEYVFKSIN